MWITDLTQAQMTELFRWRTRWLEIVDGTAPTDRPRAEAAISRLYEAGGKPRPTFLWMDSPAAATFAMAWIRAVRDDPAFRDRFGADAGNSLTRPSGQGLSLRASHSVSIFAERVSKQIGADAAQQLREQITVPIARVQPAQTFWGQLCRTYWFVRRDATLDDERTWDESIDAAGWRPTSDLAARLAADLGSGGRDACSTDWLDKIATDLTQSLRAYADENNWDAATHWAGEWWFQRDDVSVATYAVARDLLGVDLPELDPWMEAASACTLWWPLRGICIASERPIAIHRDDAGRLHHPSSAALQFADGFRVYAWHGTVVPARWIHAPDQLDPLLALRGENMELRRAAAEIVGWSRVLEHVDARVIDKHDDPMIGELLEAQLPPPRAFEEYHDSFIGRGYAPAAPWPARFLRVRCATGRDFVLSVPVEMCTALEANAWTYGMTPEEYQLEVRT